MGLTRGRRWEIQYHPATGGEVRRYFVSHTMLLVALVLAGAGVLLMVALVAVLPATVRAATTKLSAGPAQRENASLHRDAAVERERATEMVGRVNRVLQRGRRLAWTLGERASFLLQAAEDPPAGSADAEEITAWLRRHADRLTSLADTLVGQGETHRPCPLSSLPTAPPLEPSRAVPVATYGWQVSPFTGRDEAHHGVTLAAPAGETVRAPGAGRVVYAGRPRERRANEWMRWGTVVIVDHGCDRLTIFSHLGEITVRPGASVRRGDRLGVVGNSGWTRVPALYWEVRWPVGGKVRPIDPALVALWLRLDDVEGRLNDPTGGLPDNFSTLDALRLVL